MLRKIELTHFKCFEKLDLDCAPLNLLCGLNGMGKSSVMQALLVLRQSFETGELQRGNLVLGGERADLGTGADVLFEDAEGDVLGFALKSDEIEDSWKLDVRADSSSNLLYKHIDDPAGAANLFYQSLDDRSRADLLESPNIKEIVQQIRDLAMKTGDDSLQDVNRDEIVTSTFRQVLRIFAAPSSVSKSWQDVPPFGGRFVYVNAERVGPRKLYPLSDASAKRGDFGTSGEYAWNYLIHHQDHLLDIDDPRWTSGGSRRMLDVVDLWLQDVCPGAHLNLEKLSEVDAVTAEFTFDRVGDVQSRRHRATNVGFGLSYVLPVILALLSPPGTLCLIENPEAHLHPRGQTKLAELAALAANAGVQMFAETHSDHFMDGVRIAVRDGLVKPEDAYFHYFEREGNKTVATSPQVNEDGRLSRWPEGFFDQREENMARLLAPKS